MDGDRLFDAAAPFVASLGFMLVGGVFSNFTFGAIREALDASATTANAHNQANIADARASNRSAVADALNERPVVPEMFEPERIELAARRAGELVGLVPSVSLTAFGSALVGVRTNVTWLEVAAYIYTAMILVAGFIVYVHCSKDLLEYDAYKALRDKLPRYLTVIANVVGFGFAVAAAALA